MTLADEGRLPRPGERIGRYEIAALVGRGGMAAVYAVRLRSVGGFGKVLAMKVLLPHLDGPDLVTMFIDEARIAAQIQHPNVAQLFELGEHQGTPFMVMELLRGRSLAQVAERSRQRGEPLSRGFVLRVLADTARGLHAAHEARGEDGAPLAVIHRDVSPQNVHVGYDGLVKVVDFGIARARGRNTKTQSGTVKGKLSYLAPEQLSRAREVDRRVDLWALGVMAWELLVGERLFREEDEAATMFNILHKEVPRLRDRAPDLAPAVHAIVEACLRREPSQRPEAAHEVARVLDDAARALDGDDLLLRTTMEALFREDRERSELDIARAVEGLDSGVDVAPTPEVDHAAPAIEQARRRRRRALAWVGGAALLVVALGVGVALSASEPPPRAPPAQPLEVVPSAAPSPEPERTVRLLLGPGVREVRVDGARHREREVALEVAPERTALVVQIVGDDGATHDRTIDARVAEHSLELAPPEPVAAPSARARTRPARPAPRRTRVPPRAESRDRALLDNPY